MLIKPLGKLGGFVFYINFVIPTNCNMKSRIILKVSLTDTGELEVELAKEDDHMNKMVFVGILEQIKFNILNEIPISKYEVPPTKKYDA